jgi:hypothetical protein
MLIILITENSRASGGNQTGVGGWYDLNFRSEQIAQSGNGLGDWGQWQFINRLQLSGKTFKLPIRANGYLIYDPSRNEFSISGFRIGFTRVDLGDHIAAHLKELPYTGSPTADDSLARFQQAVRQMNDPALARKYCQSKRIRCDSLQWNTLSGLERDSVQSFIHFGDSVKQNYAALYQWRKRTIDRYNKYDAHLRDSIRSKMAPPRDSIKSKKPLLSKIARNIRALEIGLNYLNENPLVFRSFAFNGIEAEYGRNISVRIRHSIDAPPMDYLFNYTLPVDQGSDGIDYRLSEISFFAGKDNQKSHIGLYQFVLSDRDEAEADYYAEPSQARIVSFTKEQRIPGGGLIKCAIASQLDLKRVGSSDKLAGYTETRLPIQRLSATIQGAYRYYGQGYYSPGIRFQQSITSDLTLGVTKDLFKRRVAVTMSGGRMRLGYERAPATRTYTTFGLRAQMLKCLVFASQYSNNSSQLNIGDEMAPEYTTTQQLSLSLTASTQLVSKAESSTFSWTRVSAQTSSNLTSSDLHLFQLSNRVQLNSRAVLAISNQLRTGWNDPSSLMSTWSMSGHIGKKQSYRGQITSDLQRSLLQRLMATLGYGYQPSKRIQISAQYQFNMLTNGSETGTDDRFRLTCTLISR